jgi:hypothetical protein
MRSNLRRAVLAAPFRVSAPLTPEGAKPRPPPRRTARAAALATGDAPCQSSASCGSHHFSFLAHETAARDTDEWARGVRAGRQATQRQMSKAEGTAGELGAAEGAAGGASGKETGTARAGSEPRPVVVCGPSGVGKGTLIGKLMQTHAAQFGFSVSHTTRAPRPGEQDGVHYHFAEKAAMQAEVDQVRKPMRLSLEGLVASGRRCEWEAHGSA